jgi:flagellar basal body P-ring protein FlgI
VNLDLKSREFIHIQKVRKILDEVLYEAVASRNDSILHVASMSEVARVSYFENYIDTLKKEG